MSELADETDSKSVIRKGVRVQVPPPAVITESIGFFGRCFFLTIFPHLRVRYKMVSVTRSETFCTVFFVFFMVK